MPLGAAITLLRSGPSTKLLSVILSSFFRAICALANEIYSAPYLPEGLAMAIRTFGISSVWNALPEVSIPMIVALMVLVDFIRYFSSPSTIMAPDDFPLTRLMNCRFSFIPTGSVNSK